MFLPKMASLRKKILYHIIRKYFRVYVFVYASVHSDCIVHDGIEPAQDASV